MIWTAYYRKGAQRSRCYVAVQDGPCSQNRQSQVASQSPRAKIIIADGERVIPRKRCLLDLADRRMQSRSADERWYEDGNAKGEKGGGRIATLRGRAVGSTSGRRCV